MLKSSMQPYAARLYLIKKNVKTVKTQFLLHTIDSEYIHQNNVL